MRTRTGLTPDAWRDDGPATPARRVLNSAAMAVTVGSMLPVMRYEHPGPKHGGNIAEFNEKRAAGRRKAFSITGKPKP